MTRRRGEEYPQELRDKILEAAGSIRAVAKRFGVSPSYVGRATARLRLTGERMTRPRGGQRKRILAGRDELLRARVDQRPDVTLVELQRWLQDAHAIKISMGALWASLRRLDIRLQNSRAARVAARASVGRPPVVVPQRAGNGSGFTWERSD